MATVNMSDLVISNSYLDTDIYGVHCMYLQAACKMCCWCLPPFLSGLGKPFHFRNYLFISGLRSFEIPGLINGNAYRFRVGAVIDNDNVLSKVSKRFRLQDNTQKVPTVTPQIKHIFTLSDTSLSVQWTLPENATVNDNIDGYYIHFRRSISSGSYNTLTVFNATTHHAILDHLNPGEQYDVKVNNT